MLKPNTPHTIAADMRLIDEARIAAGFRSSQPYWDRYALVGLRLALQLLRDDSRAVYEDCFDVDLTAFNRAYGESVRPDPCIDFEEDAPTYADAGERFREECAPVYGFLVAACVTAIACMVGGFIVTLMNGGAR